MSFNFGFPNFFFGKKYKIVMYNNTTVECNEFVISALVFCIMVKVKLSLEWAMKAQRGSRNIAVLFL